LGLSLFEKDIIGNPPSGQVHHAFKLKHPLRGTELAMFFVKKEL